MCIFSKFEIPKIRAVLINHDIKNIITSALSHQKAARACVLRLVLKAKILKM